MPNDPTPLTPESLAKIREAAMPKDVPPCPCCGKERFLLSSEWGTETWVCPDSNLRPFWRNPPDPETVALCDALLEARRNRDEARRSVQKMHRRAQEAEGKAARFDIRKIDAYLGEINRLEAEKRALETRMNIHANWRREAEFKSDKALEQNDLAFMQNARDACEITALKSLVVAIYNLSSSEKALSCEQTKLLRAVLDEMEVGSDVDGT